MEIVKSRNGRSWVVQDAGRELGIVVISHAGRHGNTFYGAFSAVENGSRYDLAAHVTLTAAVERVVAFTVERDAMLERVHKVSAQVVDKRR